MMHEERARTQDIRPLHIGLLNLMPKKIATETQFLRLIGNTPLQVDIDLVMPTNHKSKNTPQDHLLKFYHPFSDIKDRRYDALLSLGRRWRCWTLKRWITGRSSARCLSSATRMSTRAFFICWASQAAFYYYYGIKNTSWMKSSLALFEHRLIRDRDITRGFDDIVLLPAFPSHGESRGGYCRLPGSEGAGAKRNRLDGRGGPQQHR